MPVVRQRGDRPQWLLGDHHVARRRPLQFVRHRHDRYGGNSDDAERNQRQQYVLKELVKQKAKLATVTRLPQIVHAIRGLIETDMTAAELTALALLARQIDTGKVISRVVPTDPLSTHRGWYARWRFAAVRK